MGTTKMIHATPYYSLLETCARTTGTWIIPNKTRAHRTTPLFAPSLCCLTAVQSFPPPLGELCLSAGQCRKPRHVSMKGLRGIDKGYVKVHLRTPSPWARMDCTLQTLLHLPRGCLIALGNGPELQQRNGVESHPLRWVRVVGRAIGIASVDRHPRLVGAGAGSARAATAGRLCAASPYLAAGGGEHRLQLGSFVLHSVHQRY